MLAYRIFAQKYAHIKVDVYQRLLYIKILRVPRFTLHPAQTTTYLYLQNFIKQYSLRGIIGAGLMITTVPTVVIYLLLNKQVQKSMIAGAIKG